MALAGFEDLLSIIPLRLHSHFMTGTPCPGRILLARGPKSWMIRKIWFTFAALRLALKSRPQVVLAAHVSLAPVAFAMAKITGGKYGVFAHGIEVWQHLAWHKRFALLNADLLISVSELTARIIRKHHGLVRGELAVIPNVTEIPSTVDGPSQSAELLTLMRDSYTLLTVGRMSSKERYKGHDVVLRALPAIMKQVPNLLYVVIGGGDDLPRLQRLAVKMNVDEAVCFVGHVREDDLPIYYQACDVFVMPSKTEVNYQCPKGEGFGIVYLEAMAHGKPVIGPNHGAPTEFLRHKENAFLVNPSKIEDVEESILYFMKHPEKARQMGEQGRKIVERKYSLDAMAHRLTELIPEIMG